MSNKKLTVKSSIEIYPSYKSDSTVVMHGTPIRTSESIILIWPRPSDLSFFYNSTKDFFSNLMIHNCLFKFFYCLYAHLLPKMSRKLFPIQKFAEKILVSREQLKMIFLVLAFIKSMERALVKKSASKFMNLFRLIVIVWTRWDFKNQNSKFFSKKSFFNVFARESQTLF